MQPEYRAVFGAEYQADLEYEDHISNLHACPGESYRRSKQHAKQAECASTARWEGRAENASLLDFSADTSRAALSGVASHPVNPVNPVKICPFLSGLISVSLWL
jgi:hypothetical protein